jgi:hypothetical protein
MLVYFKFHSFMNWVQFMPIEHTKSDITAMHHCSSVRSDSMVLAFNIPTPHTEISFATDMCFAEVLLRIHDVRASRGLLVPAVIVGTPSPGVSFFHGANEIDVQSNVTGDTKIKTWLPCNVCFDPVFTRPRDPVTVLCITHRRPCTGKALEKRRKEIASRMFMSKFFSPFFTTF